MGGMKAMCFPGTTASKRFTLPPLRSAAPERFIRFATLLDAAMIRFLDNSTSSFDACALYKGNAGRSPYGMIVVF
jgi:hypothetical protein